MNEIYSKIMAKAELMCTLNTHSSFLAVNPNSKKADKQTFVRLNQMIAAAGHKITDKTKNFQEKLKEWKEMQTSKGSIVSFTELKDEIWKSGSKSILGLLQIPIDADRFKLHIEKICCESLKRVAGLKIMSQLLENQAPWEHVRDQI